MTPVTDRGELLFQRRLAENRIAAAGQIREMGSILEGAMERIYGTKEDVPLEQEIGKRLLLYGNNIDPGIFLQSRRTKATSLCDHAYKA